LEALVDLSQLPERGQKTQSGEDTSMQSIGFFRILAGAAIALAGTVSLQPAQAQDDAASYPNKPIRLIVPFAAGGGNDIFARLVGDKVREFLGQPVVIENKPGASGFLAFQG
jgi:tripartite-type tricarboxylate transporter receptor subunit TctC